MQPFQLFSGIAAIAGAAMQLGQLSCTSSAATCSNSSSDSHAALQLCSRAAVQPCSRAAVQPCSLAAMQPCSHAALQPCSLAAMQPCSPRQQPCSFTPFWSCGPNEKPQNLRYQQQPYSPATNQKPQRPSRKEALQLKHDMCLYYM